MKTGVRAIGVAESYVGDRSTLAGVVVRADRTVDGLAFSSCSVGGTDATAGVVALLDELAREDARYVLVSGIAPAWYNVLDLRAINEADGRPLLSITFEPSEEGLTVALRREFAGEELDARLATYRDQPSRERLVVNGEPVFVRAVGLDAGEARDVVRAFTPEGGRPEPLRVARFAARAADRWRADS